MIAVVGGLVFDRWFWPIIQPLLTPDGTVSVDDGHLVLIYDERNPAFHVGGSALAAYIETRRALREPTMLRKCSWQRIIQHIRHGGFLSWLTEQLALKYGL